MFNRNDELPRELLVKRHFRWRTLLPSPGNVLFTLLIASLLVVGQTAGAFSSHPESTAASTSIIPYQGRLADAGGNALNGSYAMTFKLYNVANAGSPLWTENWSAGNSVTVTAGLFNVLLGSLTPIPASVYTANNSLWLGISVGVDAEMTPRVQLGSVPFAGKAQVMPNQSITTAMLANGAVSLSKLAAYPVIYSAPEIGGSTSQPAAVSMSAITITVGYTATILLVSAGDASMSAAGTIVLSLNRDTNQIQGLDIDFTAGSPRQAMGMTAADTVGPGTYVYDAKIAPVTAVTANWGHFRLTAIVIPSP